MRLVPALAGASAGLALVVVWERERLEAGPDGWESNDPQLPVYLSSLAGAPRLPGEGWPLGSRFQLRQAGEVQRVTVRADLPPGASLSLALVHDRGDDLVLTVPRFPGGAVSLGKQDLRQQFSPGLVELSGCTGSLGALPEGEISLGLELGQGVRAWVGEQEVRCPWGERTGRPMLIAGLKRVGLHELSTDQSEQRAPGPAWPHRLLAAALGLCLGLVGARLPRLRRYAGLVGAPFLVAGPLALADLEAWSQAARLLPDHPLRLALVLPALLSAMLLSIVGAVGLARRGKASLPLTVGFGGLVGGGLVALASPQWPVSIALAAATGASLGGLVWVNVHAASVRFFNLLSLGLIALAVVGAENALTWTATGQRVMGVSNRAAAGWTPHMEARDPLSHLRDVETGRQHRVYPSEGYPVAPPPRTAPVRIVALGSSSTGGAFQFDNLDQFWPAELGRQLGPQVQVVNQAVGGWTSLHVRRYLETRLEDVDPDIFVVYLGNNDLKERSDRPYRELLAQVQAEAGGGGSSQPVAAAIGAAMGRVRLLQLLRLSLSPVSTQSQGAAVPLAHARENLRAIIDLGAGRGARTLLVSEAIYPDPAESSSYAELVAGLADGDQVRSLDGADILLGATSWTYFLDNVHLSVAGHVRLATAVREELQAAGWVSGP